MSGALVQQAASCELAAVSKALATYVLGGKMLEIMLNGDAIGAHYQ